MATAPLPSPLLYADTESSPDALYFGRVTVPDAFIAFGLRGKKYAVVSVLEFGRVKRDSSFDVVLPLEQYMRRARETWPKRRNGPAEVISLISKELRQKHFVVPAEFPAGVYRKLLELGLRVDIADGALFPEREIKTVAEAAALRAGNHASACGLAAGEWVLRASKIKAGRLVYRGETLTSERLKFAIEVACLEAGAMSVNTIAAGGDQACDPHHRGTGPLRAHQLIILDIFPRMIASGYYGDMTRTFLRGRASEAQRKLVATVRTAQQAALRTIRAGVDGRAVHGAASGVFAAAGYETKATGHGSVGFFHGTGHGLGLAVHELPRVNASTEYPLKAGSVVTVEPGLYYPGLGGCRIEDVVQVTRPGYKLLSDYGYGWEL